MTVLPMPLLPMAVLPMTVLPMTLESKLTASSNPQWKDVALEIHQAIGFPPLREAQGRDFRKA